MGRHTRMVWVALACIGAIIAVYACGGKGARTIPQIFSANGAHEHATSPITTKPEDILMKRLTAAFENALAARAGKSVAAAPSGEDNLIVDLNYTLNGLEGNHLTWHYRNLGDYNQDGVVNIADLTPLAMHFGETIAENPLVEVIDGDMDVIVGIGDAGVIGTYFQNTVSAYVVESSAAEDGEYAEVGRVEFADATGGTDGWKGFAFALTSADALWYRVVPVDAQDARGIPSMPVQFQSPSLAPRIISISPSRVEPDTLTEMVAVVQGEEPFTYEWYFAATDMPAYSTDASPKVYFKDLGRHVCRLKVTNAHGQHTYYFAVLVAPTEYPPFIFKLWPTTATANTTTQFFAQASGTEPLSWHWNFGGGAIPNESNEAWPKVKLSQPGTYNASLTVTNALGQDTYYFTLTITPATMPPVIERVWPTAVTAYTQTQLYAQVSGTEPLTWHWDFGGGAIPNETNDAWPTIKPRMEGSYESSLTVVNSQGQDTYDFILEVGSEDQPPVINSAWPVFTEEHSQTQFFAEVSGAEQLNWQWDFGGGAIPNESTDAAPVVQVSAAGQYDCTLHVTNALGSADYVFTYVVAPSGTWRMFGRESTHNSRSTLTGPQNATVKWRYSAGAGPFSNAVVNSEGTIFVGNSSGFRYAINPDGTLQWKQGYYTPEAMGYPTITIDGTTKWRYGEPGEERASTIGPDGSEYSIYNNFGNPRLDANNADGSRWSCIVTAFDSSPTIGPERTIYVAGYDAGYDGEVSAISPHGIIKWSCNIGGFVSGSLAVGADGTVYAGSDHTGLSALSPNGSLLWCYEIDEAIQSSPAIGEDGTIYIGSDDGYLYAINPNGTLKWRFSLGGSATGRPAIGGDGTVYVTSDGVSSGTLYAVKEDGTLLWSFQAKPWKGASPAIGFDGTLYIGNSDGIFYAFQGDSPARIESVSPTVWRAGGEVTLKAVVSGSEPLSYSWDFGGGATPNSSSDESPTVTLNSAGDYNARLIVSNSYGEDVYDFTLASFSPLPPGDWSMFGREPTHNRRSPYIGPQTSNLMWRLVVNGNRSSPAIASDGTIYIGSSNKGLSAVSPDGTIKWSCDIGAANNSSPGIGADGTVYIGSLDGYIYAISPDGDLIWRYETRNSIRSSPTIGVDGTIMVIGSDGYLIALNPDGSLKWRYPYESYSNQYLPSPAIGEDEIVYFAGDYYLKALYPDGSVKWDSWLYYDDASSPSIAADGVIYTSFVGDYYNPFSLWAINSDGSLKWYQELYPSYYYETSSSTAIGADGTIYVGSADYYLYAISPGGTLKWRYLTGNSVGSSPALGADGTIYVGSNDSYIYALNPDGTLKWRYKAGGSVHSSPAIGNDGTLYVCSDLGYLYAFHD